MHEEGLPLFDLIALLHAQINHLVTFCTARLCCSTCTTEHAKGDILKQYTASNGSAVGLKKTSSWKANGLTCAELCCCADKARQLWTAATVYTNVHTRA